jgi:outer membrane lipopolysaccharide assembly protein LptE/RlpB
MKNKLFIILLLLFLTSCGYSAIYKNTESNNFLINIIGMQGDADMNDLINNELELYSNQDSDNKFDLNMNTNFERKIISKNTSGAASSYQLSAKVEFTIMTKTNKEKVIFVEKLNIENNSDSFAQKSYENTIKKNFANSIKEKLILKLSSFK